MNVRADRAVVTQLTMAAEPYLSCDECFDQVDRAIEQVVAGGAELDEALRLHLLTCAACHEEAVTLAALVAADSGVAEDAAIETLSAALAR